MRNDAVVLAGAELEARLLKDGVSAFRVGLGCEVVEGDSLISGLGHG